MKTHLAQLVAGKPLTVQQAREAFDAIMAGDATPAQIGSMLSLIESRGATVEEIVGAAQAMRGKAYPVRVPDGLRVIDTCGAGGAHATTFNISTTAAIVAAAAGRPRNMCVAKHGNRSVTSRSGSSDLLAAMGVKLKVAPETLTRCLDETGFCFCFAPAHHPAMKHAAPVRGELGFRTIFNLLGPLTNPAGAKFQLVGVPNEGLLDMIAEVLKRLGAEQAMVVHCKLPDGRGVGELLTVAPTMVAHLHQGRIDRYEIDAEAQGLKTARIEDLSIEDTAASAEVVQGVLTGQPGPPRDVVLLNAAAALLIAEVVNDLRQGIELAALAIDNGDANRVLETVAEITREDPTPVA
jgi:anthranilate phosphoribosyltransferase